MFHSRDRNGQGISSIKIQKDIISRDPRAQLSSFFQPVCLALVKLFCLTAPRQLRLTALRRQASGSAKRQRRAVVAVYPNVYRKNLYRGEEARAGVYRKLTVTVFAVWLSVVITRLANPACQACRQGPHVNLVEPGVAFLRAEVGHRNTHAVQCRCHRHCVANPRAVKHQVDLIAVQRPG